MAVRRHPEGAHEDIDRTTETSVEREQRKPEIFRQRSASDAEVERATAHQRAYDRFGGVNPGAAFFGWLGAMGLTALLAGIVAAGATALDREWSQADAENAAGTVGLVSAGVLLVVLLIGYFAGGYVAGRMSRFDGAKQGMAVWALGLIVTVLAAAAGWVAGEQYNVLDRVDLPQIPIPSDQLTWGGVATGLLILLGTLLAAMAGGKLGHRYHDKVDDEAYTWR